MSRGKIALGVAAAVTAASTLLFGGVLRGPGTEQTRAATRGFASGSLTGLASGGTAQLVERLQTAVRTAPQDVKSLDLLGLAYQQRARETGDPAYYTKSDGVLRRALRFQPNDLLATSGLGSLALPRHRLREPVPCGRRARGVRMDLRAARQDLLVDGKAGGCRDALPRSARALPGIRLCLRHARAGRGRARSPAESDRARATGSRHDSAAAIRGRARRHGESRRNGTQGPQAVRVDRCHPAPAGRERGQDRPRDRVVRRRPRDRLAACARAGA